MNETFLKQQAQECAEGHARCLRYAFWFPVTAILISLFASFGVFAFGLTGYGVCGQIVMSTVSAIMIRMAFTSKRDWIKSGNKWLSLRHDAIRINDQFKKL